MNFKKITEKNFSSKKSNIVLHQFLIFFVLVILSICGYLVSIRTYMEFVSDPIIFLGSVLCAIFIPLSLFVVIRWKLKNLYDIFTSFIVCFFCCITILGFAVFGPVFIDRSISYHIAFYAAEEGNVSIDDIKECFSTAIFDKRIHDAQVSGFIKMQSDGSFVPTKKAKLMTSVLKPIGEFSHSLNTYEVMKKEVKEHEEKATITK